MTKKFTACSISGCALNASHNAHGRKGMCCTHYQRAAKHGDPAIVKPVPRPALDWLELHVNYAGDDCLKWPFATGRDGYGRAHMPGTQTLVTSSRLMCILAHGNPPTPAHEAAHHCGNGKTGCTNPRHIYWATPLRNQSDRIKHGTTNRGERQWNARLREDDIRTIRILLKRRSQKSIAADFNVDPSHILDIKRGKKWAWLT